MDWLQLETLSYHSFQLLKILQNVCITDDQDVINAVVDVKLLFVNLSSWSGHPMQPTDTEAGMGCNF